uniref:Lef11 n=1 Tax=Spodoptera exigua multiple nucleopolyhedrovirus TaxID=10454 RepID=A0A6N0C2D2_9ABAC|nr:lef11 [Spodoptera exigua multiple nucleopolyhedrovirus]
MLAANSNERFVNICPYIFDMFLKIRLENVRQNVGHVTLVFSFIDRFPDIGVDVAAR